MRTLELDPQFGQIPGFYFLVFDLRDNYACRLLLFPKDGSLPKR
ncbi:hypothetical protein [Sedimentitalea sp. HM32M-2]